MRTLAAFIALICLCVGCGRQNSTEAPATNSQPSPANAPAIQRPPHRDIKTTSNDSATNETAVTQASNEAGNASAIQGKVVFTGTAPAEFSIDMAADASCAALHSTLVTTRHYVVNEDHTLQNVFVYVKSGDGIDGKRFEPPKTAVVLDQKGCLYLPYVLGVQVGQDFKIVNSDSTLHNVHALPALNQEFNKGQAVAGMSYTHKFTKPEIMVKFKCDVHPWMFAYVGVVTHPFFDVTRQAGTFKLKGLPPGTYVIEAWHPKAGSLTNTVSVGENETKEVTFEFNAK